MAQCEYTRYYDNKRCTETAQAGQSLCILHDGDDAKDAAEFLKALRDKVEREESDAAFTEVNLAGVVFPPRFRWADIISSGKALRKSADFQGAKFSGDANFWGAAFSGDADFWGATFSGAATFVGATFSGAANFLGAAFSGAASFRGATFSGAAYFWGATFSGAAYFGDAKFTEAADFGHATFSGAADFEDATFSGAANFWRATFSGDANFGAATFSGDASFWRATFSGAASFGGATFSGDANFWGATFKDRLRFQGTTFPRDAGPGVVVFTNVTLEKPERAYFQDVNLSRVSFLGTDIRQVRFLNTTWAKLPKRLRPSPRWWPFTTARAVWRRRARWPRSWPLVLMTAVWRRRPMWLWRWPRWWPTWLRTRSLNVLYDDPRVSRTQDRKERRYHQAAELYRQLRVNLEENRQHIEAGDFYVGQMDMRLHSGDVAWRKLLWLYGRAVLYGESYWRPLALYGFTALLFGLGYLWAGFQWSPRQVHRPVLDIAAVADLAFWKDFGEAVVLALRAGPIPVSEPAPVSRWLLPLRYLNALLNVLWLALAVIALRRAFRR